MWRLRYLGCEPTEPSLYCVKVACRIGDPAYLDMLFSIWFGGRVVVQPWNPGDDIVSVECKEYRRGGMGGEGGDDEDEPYAVDIVARSSDGKMYGTRCVRVYNDIVCYPLPVDKR